MKSRYSVVMFTMKEQGHLHRLLPIVSELTAMGARVHVFTDSQFKSKVENAGGRHVDLFQERPLESADSISIPKPCRYVSFAAHYAKSVVEEAAALRPSLVIHDTFAVIGAVVAWHLRLPKVNVCIGHNHAPGPTVESLRHDPRVAISEACWKAVSTLRDRHGLVDASPFSYLTTLSKELNLYCEPPQYLKEEERTPFEPLAFMGSLSLETIKQPKPLCSPFGKYSSDKLRIYVSFGTIIWRYYSAEAYAALETISEAAKDLPEALVLVSLGNGQADDWGRHLERSNVLIKKYVNQWNILRDASVFITHHGLNSTHEAIFNGIPMISYPFMADQPVLAKRCQELGLAVALTNELRGPITAKDIHSALTKVATQSEDLKKKFSEAREWELEVIAGRRRVIKQILSLIK